MRQIVRRISLLEQASCKASRQFIVWDDYSGKAEIEAAAIEKEQGGNVEVVLVGWLPSDFPSTAVMNEAK